jgi:arginine decarboxylase-like protein
VSRKRFLGAGKNGEKKSRDIGGWYLLYIFLVGAVENVLERQYHSKVPDTNNVGIFMFSGGQLIDQLCDLIEFKLHLM